ncbi:hypothetical protein FQN54_008980 [Arachnomyces sp. PD_36]|nr:hypothetical protein FQN54_008980 [Arachnomyces sp. PD_36]
MTLPSRLPRFFLPVIATAILLIQSASAWSFQWRNDEGDAYIELGMGNQTCKSIDHGKNQPFEWDPKTDPFCISLFSDSKCEYRVGYTCNPWPHDSTRELKSFEVNGTLSTSDDIFDTTTTTVLPESTTSSMTTSIKTDTPTDASTSLPETDPGESGGDDSLSGGAIAGIVIGVVAVIVLAVIAWVLLRRRRQPPPPQAPSTAGYSASGNVPPMSESGATTATTTTTTAVGSAPGTAPPIAKWGAPTSPVSPSSPEEPLSAAPAYSPAPPEGTKMAELSDSHQIVELQGSDPVSPRPVDSKVHEKP